MKFYVTSTVWDSEDELLKHYPALKNFGHNDHCITINTIEELMNLLNEVGKSICVFCDPEVYDRNTRKWVKIGIPEIEIYDGYRE